MTTNREIFEEAVTRTDIVVRFAETDLMGIVHHSAYIVWFEVGRVDWMGTAEMPYTEIAAGGHHFAVTGIQAEYRAATHFGDPVQVVTRLADLRSRQVSFVYELRHATTQALLATGRSDHICVDDDGRMAKIPREVTARLMSGAEALALAADKTSGGSIDTASAYR